jgi:hypothetical protein
MVQHPTCEDHIMKALAKGKRMTCGDIADLTGYGFAAIYNATKRLAAQGLVDRSAIPTKVRVEMSRKLKKNVPRWYYFRTKGKTKTPIRFDAKRETFPPKEIPKIKPEYPDFMAMLGAL